MNHKFFDISSAQDLLEKAKRDYISLCDNLNTDNIFNFFVTIYHVKDYILVQRLANKQSIEKIFEDNDFQICELICNKGKHLGVNRNATQSFQAHADTYFGNDVIYEAICDGKKIEVVELGKRLIEKWETFFKENGI